MSTYVNFEPHETHQKLLLQVKLVTSYLFNLAIYHQEKYLISSFHHLMLVLLRVLT